MDSLNLKVINSSKILENLKLYKNKKICAMVKANAYGLGLEYILKVLDKKVDFFGVANLNEALKVRRFTNSKVLIVGKCFDFKTCYENNISYTIFNEEDSLKAITNSKVHIKIDSGMNRLGIKSKRELKKVIKNLNNNKVNIEGVFTHFATINTDNYFYEKQVTNFNKLLKYVPDVEYIHAGGGDIAFKDVDKFDMVRVGYNLYSGAVKIYSRLIRVFKIKAGERIGYSNGYIASQDMKIGVVPLGYADGINRKLSNNYSVKINGRDCAIIGFICMDMFMIDVSSIKCNEGDEVLVLNDEIEVADRIGTIGYEVLTGLNSFRGETIII